MVSKKNKERSNQGCTSAHTWAEKVKRKAKVWLAMYTHIQREKQFGMTYISSAQCVAKMYPTVLGSWLQQTWTRGGGEGQRERESECG